MDDDRFLLCIETIKIKISQVDIRLMLGVSMKYSSTGAKIPLGPYSYNDQKRRPMMNEIFNFL